MDGGWLFSFPCLKMWTARARDGAYCDTHARAHARTQCTQALSQTHAATPTAAAAARSTAAASPSGCAACQTAAAASRRYLAPAPTALRPWLSRAHDLQASSQRQAVLVGVLTTGWHGCTNWPRQGVQVLDCLVGAKRGSRTARVALQSVLSAACGVGLDVCVTSDQTRPPHGYTTTQRCATHIDLVWRAAHRVAWTVTNI